MSARTRASSPSGGMRYALYLHDIFDGLESGTAAINFILNQIAGAPVQITETVTIDRLISICTFVAGNIRMAIYPDNGAFAPDGSPLLVETASVAVVAAKNELPIANTRLTPGLYWFFQNRDTNTQWVGYVNARLLGGTIQSRIAGVAYGPFPAVCPATLTIGDGLKCWARVFSIP